MARALRLLSVAISSTSIMLGNIALLKEYGNSTVNRLGRAEAAIWRMLDPPARHLTASSGV